MDGNNPSVASWSLSSGLTALTTTDSTTLRAAVTAARHFVSGLQLSNNITNATNVVSILDDTTVIWSKTLLASESAAPPIGNLIGSPNKALNIQCGTAGSVTWNIHGYDAP